MDGDKKGLSFLILLSMSFSLCGTIIGPTLPLYMTELGATKFELGLLISISSVVVITTTTPLGMLADRIGRRPMIVSAQLLQVAYLLLYFFAPGAGWLYPIRVLQALAATSFGPAAVALASDMSSKGRRGAALGTYMTSAALTQMAGPLINSAVIGFVGYRRLFLLALAFPILGLAISSTRLMGRLRTLEEALRARREAGGGGQPVPLSIFLRSRVMSSVLVSRFAWNMAEGMFNTLFALYLANELSVALPLIGVLLTLKGFLNATSRLPAGRISDRIGRKRPLLASYAYTALFLVLLSEVRSLPLIALFLAVEGFAYGTRVVSEFALLGDELGGRRAGAAWSLFYMWYDVGAGTGAVLAGALASTLPITTVFKIAAASLAVGAIPAVLMKLPSRAAPDGSQGRGPTSNEGKKADGGRTEGSGSRG